MKGKAESIKKAFWNNTARKCGRTRSFLTGFLFRGVKLKDRSAGGWRSGRPRSEK